MMKSTPAAPFIMSQAEFLLQLFVVSLDDPALLGQMDQLAEPMRSRHSGQPIFGRFGFTLRPFDQQPFFRMRLLAPVVAMRGTHAQRGKSRTERMLRSLPPSDFFQTMGQEKANSLTETG